MSNPSRAAVSELYDWLEKTSLPITEDGDFLAYKKVRDDYRDFHTGTWDNSVGRILTMPRNQVDDERDRHCSTGLHFCSLSYLPRYHGGRGRVMIVKINPGDVVSIPSDYDYAKGRTCGYQVIGEHREGEHREAFDKPIVGNQGQALRDVGPTPSAGNTTVMGVDWGSPRRAALVRELVDRPLVRHGVDCSEQEGSVHGHSDAVNEMDPNLSRYTGNHLASQVNYARSYFARYDQTVGAMSRTWPSHEFDFVGDDQARAIDEIMLSPLSQTPLRHGSKLGWDHGFQSASLHQVSQEKFDLTPALLGGKNYRKAYVEGYLSAFNGQS
jgi:signal peptidase I